MLIVSVIAGLVLALSIYARGGHPLAGRVIRRPFLVAAVGAAALAVAYDAGAGLWSLLALGTAATFTLGHGTLLGFLDRVVDGRASGWAPFSTGVMTGVALALPLAASLYIAGHGPAAAVLILAGFLKPFCYGAAGMADRIAPFPDRDAVAGALHGASFGIALAISPILPGGVL